MHADAAKFKHDLRNLINTFRLSIAAMNLEKNPAERVEWLNAIIAAADSGVQIIDEYAPIQEEADFNSTQ